MNIKPVLCVETGQVFDSVKAAAEWVGLSNNAVSMAARGECPTAGGYHWEYAPEEDVEAYDRPAPSPRRSPKKTIRDVQEEARRRTEETGRPVRYADLQKEETLEMIKRRAGLERLKRQRREKR